MASKVGIIIQARMGSRRFPSKSLKKINEYPIIEWVIRSCKCISNIDHIILATSENIDCDPLVNYVSNIGINIFRGEEENVLSRFKKIIDLYNLDIVIRITGDDPCHDPLLIEKAINKFKKKKLII